MTVEPKYTDLHKVAVTGIVWRFMEGKRKYLITKRSSNKKVFPEKWTVPGGALETTDYINDPPTHIGNQWYNTVEKTLRREIKEETGIEVDDIRFLLDVAVIQDDGTPMIVLSYFSKHASGDVVINEESTEFAWVTASEAKGYDLIAGIDEEIQRVDDLLLLEN